MFCLVLHTFSFKIFYILPLCCHYITTSQKKKMINCLVRRLFHVWDNVIKTNINNCNYKSNVNKENTKFSHCFIHYIQFGTTDLFFVSHRLFHMSFQWIQFKQNTFSFVTYTSHHQKTIIMIIFFGHILWKNFFSHNKFHYIHKNVNMYHIIVGMKIFFSVIKQ